MLYLSFPIQSPQVIIAREISAKFYFPLALPSILPFLNWLCHFSPLHLLHDHLGNFLPYSYFFSLLWWKFKLIISSVIRENVKTNKKQKAFQASKNNIPKVLRFHKVNGHFWNFL